MANVAATISARSNARSIVMAWLAMTTTNNIGVGRDGGLCQFPAYPDRTVQITGTFGTGGSVQIEGSNDGGTTWTILTDPLGNNLVFTSSGMKQITEMPDAIRAKVTAGDGTTSLNVYIAGRGNINPS